MSSDDQYELQKHLVHFFAGLNIHKAFGEDMVPPALLKMFPDVFARMFLPCYVSCVEHGIEPVQWSGGCLHDMPKKVHSNCVSMRRGVLLEDILAKGLHSFCRAQLSPYISSYLLSSMYGGFLNRGVDFGILHLRALSNIAKSRKQSFGVLFVDVKAAFESVIRCLVFGEKMSDEGVVHTFSRLGFSPAVFGDFCRILSDPHSFFLSNVPSRLCNLVRNLHDGAWFSISGLSHVSVTQTGSRAGDPLGDIVFMFLMCRVLRECRRVLRDSGLVAVDPIKCKGLSLIHI